jgi:methyl-accepting chemotaxis protein
LIEPVLAMRNKLMASGGTAAAQGVSAPEWWSATTARINAFKAAETGLATAIAGQIDELTAEKYSDLVSVLGWSALCIAAITLITILVARSVIRPLRAITRVLDAINRGEEGLAAPMGLPDRSEIGKIANAMSLFRENAIERRKMAGTALAIRQDELRRQTMLETILRKYRERMAAIAAGLERETGDMRAPPKRF